MAVRGIRGATTCKANTEEEILSAVKELWIEMQKKNEFIEEDLASVIFSSTPDLTAAFPATAVRSLGWESVPLFGTMEIEKPNSVKLCVRILVHWNTQKSHKDVQHVYLKGSRVLRKDLTSD